jgi:hypothetical protein
MNARRCVLAILLAAWALATGCAGIVRLDPPAEFRDKKVKEDPPGSCLPFEQGGREVRAC